MFLSNVTVLLGMRFQHFASDYSMLNIISENVTALVFE